MTNKESHYYSKYYVLIANAVELTMKQYPNGETLSPFTLNMQLSWAGSLG